MKRQHQSDEKLRHLSENLLNTMLYQLRIESDGRRRFTYVSEGVRSLHGCSPEQAMADSRCIYGNVFEGDRQRLREEEELALASLTTFEIEVRMQTPDREVRWSQIVSRPCKLEDGAVLWDGIEIDISNRKHTKAVVGESEEKFRSIFESSQDAILTMDPVDNRFTAANPATLKIFRIATLEEFVAVGPINLSPERQPDGCMSSEKAQRMITTAMREGAVSFEWTHRRMNGEEFFADVLLSRVDQGGKPMLLGTVRDITDRKQKESVLRESEEKFSKAFHSSPVGMLLSTKKEGRYLDVNATFLNILQRTREEVIGHTAVELGVWADTDQRDSFLSKLKAGGWLHNVEVSWRNKSGVVRDFVVSGDELVIGGIDCVVGSVLDITERKKAEQRVLQLNRIYAVLSDINQIIVREKDVKAMLTSACRIAVDTGKFRMVWIAMFNPATQKMESATSAGVVENYTDLVNIDLQDESRRRGPVATSLLTGEHSICNDIEHDPNFLPWREEALRRGYRSCGGFPLKVEGKTVGVFTLYGDAPQVFDDQEVLLLDELAMDIGYALEISERETVRRRIEQELNASEERYKVLFENAPDAVLLMAADGDDIGRILAANKIAARMHGYTPGELVGKRIEDLSTTGPSAERLERFRRIALGDSLTFEVEHRRKDGTMFPVEVGANRIMIGGRSCVLAFERDISDRKRAEGELRKSQGSLAAAVEAAGLHLYEEEGDERNNRRMTFLDDGMRELLGIPQDQQHRARDYWIERIHPDDLRNIMTAAIRQFEEEGQNIVSAEYRYSHVNRGEIWFRHAAHALERNGKGEVLRLVGAVQDITKAKRAEQALRESNERLAALFEGGRDAVLLADAQTGIIMDANKEATRLLDRPKESLIGLHQTQIHPPELEDKCRDLFRKHLIQPRTESAEVEVMTSAGVRIPVEISGSMVEIAPGKRVIQGIFRDLSARKAADAALQRQESILSSYFRASPVGLGMTRNRVLWEANDRLCEMTGYTRGELIGQCSSILYADQEEFERVGRELYALIETQPVGVVECRWRRKDGTIYDVLMQSSLLDSANHAAGMTSAITDITERKRVEDSHARLATVVEQAAETIVITDTKGTILYANPAFERTTGYTCGEAVGQNPRVLKSGKQSEEFYRSMWEALERGEVWHGHFINRHKNGTYYEEEATISPVRDVAGKIVSYVAVKRDVTREVQLEKQFLEAQKMESVGHLAGGVAHDFNNMLAAMMMHLSLLQQGKALAPETQETINELIKEAERAAGLTRQLLLFSRRSVMDVKLLDLNEVVTNLLKMLGRLIGEHVVVKFARREGLPALEGDAGMIEQVIMNLAVNARDAMPNGGEIDIAIEAVELGSEQIAGKTDAPAGKFLYLTVADNGCGMDEATRRRIFEPFFTTKEPGKGTGLGLATVHGIVAQHNGWVEVETEMGKGTTFKIFLPGSTNRIIAATTAAKTEVRGGQETILVVEDEASVRRLVALSFRTLGYAVFEVENGQAAMDLWHQRRGEFDLLFSDMVMPGGLTGLDLAERFRKENPNLKVIISSGYSAETSGQSRLAALGIIYIQKPYRTEKLAKVVRECLDGKS